MKSLALLDNLVFKDENPNAEPILVDSSGRIIRFTLKPGQSIREHKAPSSPLFIVVLQGRGRFTGGDGQPAEFGPHSLLVFDVGETHAVEALDEELVFLAILRQTSDTLPPESAGGLLGRGG
ncbi:MAG: cupin domain-containing protein [Anaerolineales bacterium]|nr:cupin domain-containing protein [Anaerolineales bacterium]